MALGNSWSGMAWEVVDPAWLKEEVSEVIVIRSFLEADFSNRFTVHHSLDCAGRVDKTNTPEARQHHSDLAGTTQSTGTGLKSTRGSVEEGRLPRHG